MSLILSILGAESTGKSTLAHALVPAMVRHTGTPWVCVDEVLREWVDVHGRTPKAHEQRSIALEQQRRIAHAAQSASVVADTSALMTAVYSSLIFGDDSLFADALVVEASYHRSVLTSLDVPWQSDGLQRDGEHLRDPVDACLVGALHRSGRDFVRLTGPVKTRIDQVLVLFPDAGHSHIDSNKLNESRDQVRIFAKKSK